MQYPLAIMQSNRSDSMQSQLLGVLDPEIVLGVATAPVLVAIVGGLAIAKTIQELGEMSEELFRGDRLPILEFSDRTHSPDEP
jgi:3-oxoacyl-ACP reductase-like protein